jgi:hypothetical protein
MRKMLLTAGLVALALAVPLLAAAALPEPTEVEIIDVPNDDGSALGVLWFWEGDAGPDIRVTIEADVTRDEIENYMLTEAEMEKLLSARADLLDRLGPVLPELYAAEGRAAEVQERLQVAEANREPEATTIRREYWNEQSEVTRLTRQRNELWEWFEGRLRRPGGDYLFERAQIVEYLSATLGQSNWVPLEEAREVTLRDDGTWPAKGEAVARFGHRPDEPDKVYYEVSVYRAVSPRVYAGTFTDEPDEIDYEAPRTIPMSLERGRTYNLRMLVERIELDGGEWLLDENDQPVVAEGVYYELRGGAPRVNFFNGAYLNNLIFAVGFAVIILIAIMLARRNPNMFIRRISGLEAVDEAIGRATEMGKPVLYLCGLDSLATLSTLAAINILGRVARRIADYDSDLVVPNRDPVVLTVAQEVVREAYIDQGRPDAYKEDNIFFVTDDQFSFTATTCAIMMRERPAANFFMGYYYAESLLLAETGASTGAIQIAGTDALHQLPFFITTCDYTLIGEELYAASAYLSREPMLLGSLKGQDLGKALIMVLIIIQTLLFAIHAAIALYNPGILQQSWDWLKLLVEPL